MKLKHKLLSLAIAIVLVFFIGYGIELFIDNPRYDDFCPVDVNGIRDAAACSAAGGEWQDGEGIARPVPERGFCGETKACRDSFQNARNAHDKVVFIVAVIGGIAALVSGFILKHESVTNGLVGGGILSILYGTIRYWEHADELLKFVLLGLTLGLLIWVGYKKIS
jgi:hypothetical protein